jgi:hypothetical protein
VAVGSLTGTDGTDVKVVSVICHDPYLHGYDSDANFFSLTFLHIPYPSFSLTLILIIDYLYLMAIRPLFTMTHTYLKAVPT